MLSGRCIGGAEEKVLFLLFCTVGNDGKCRNAREFSFIISYYYYIYCYVLCFVLAWFIEWECWKCSVLLTILSPPPGHLTPSLALSPAAPHLSYLIIVQTKNYPICALDQYTHRKESEHPEAYVVQQTQHAPLSFDKPLGRHLRSVRMTRMRVGYGVWKSFICSFLC